jgi:hypothetical protein
VEGGAGEGQQLAGQLARHGLPAADARVVPNAHKQIVLKAKRPGAGWRAKRAAGESVDGTGFGLGQELVDGTGLGLGLWISGSGSGSLGPGLRLGVRVWVLGSVSESLVSEEGIVRDQMSSPGRGKQNISRVHVPAPGTLTWKGMRWTCRLHYP